MRLARLLAPAIALALATLLALPRTVEGFVTLLPIFTLSTNTRDIRFFNDFPVSANLNQTPDPNFPSAVGAALAVWKGATEWASTLHNGSGAGDPTQGFPGGLGSGLANFDFFYLGEVPTPPAHNAAGVPTNDNDRIAHMAAANPNPGVLAVTINPDPNGWHIEFMPDSLWFDGPGNMSPGDPRFDIQGILSHEIGHALGLAHTNVAGATMLPVAAPGPAGTVLRSIELDDRQGVQFIYGVASATKPRIFGFQGIVAAQQPMTIIGQNFGTGTGTVAVWFRDDAADNTPRQIGGLTPAFAGTQVSVVPPCDVVNGDVFVKVGTATTGNTLSNGMPLILQSGGNGTPCLQCIGNLTPISAPVLSALPTEVFVNAPAPTTGTLICLPTAPACPAAAQYSTVTQLNVGPFSVGLGQFTVDNDTQIRFSLPLFSSLGTFNVTLTNPGGLSCPSTLTVTAVPSPVLVTGPPIQTSGSTFTATLAAPLGMNHILVFSALNLPFVLPGIVSLGIGGPAGNLNVLPTPLPSAAGIAQLQFTIPPVAGSATVYFQMVALNASNPFAVLPFPVSNVTSVTVL